MRAEPRSIGLSVMRAARSRKREVVSGSVYFAHIGCRWPVVSQESAHD